MRILSLFILILSWSANSWAQIPDGYYDSAEGQEAQDLREALKNIIDNHDIQSYSSLWNWFEDTDANEEGKVWDMYSDQPGNIADYYYNFGSDQCGSYDEEGDCFNREHSFPSSWFDGNTPMNSDLFQLYPTDGYVNNRRNNYPFGTVENASWTSSNGSKLGSSSFPGYNGIVFEPIDEYKGDFARTYFYMLTRYMDFADSWSSPMLLDGDFVYWAKEMLIDWADNDQVSEKEQDRNNAVYQIQDNRNPFIDRPEFVELIWPADTSETIDIIHYSGLTSFWYSSSYIYQNNLLEGNEYLNIYNYQGQLISTELFEEERLNLNFLSPGMYFAVFPMHPELPALRFVH